MMNYNMKLEDFLDLQTYKKIKARREQHYTVLSTVLSNKKNQTFQ